MKLQGVSIKYSQIDNDDFRESWTFVIDGLPFNHSIGQMHGSFEKAQERAEQIVYNVLTQGE